MGKEYNLAKAVCFTAKQIAELGVGIVLTSGRSAPFTGNLLKWGWRQLYDESTVPKVINFGSDFNKDSYCANSLGPEIDSGLRVYLRENYSEVLSYDPKVYLDDHAYTGMKIDSLIDKYPKLGINNVSFAVFVTKFDSKKKYLYGLADQGLARYFNDIHDMYSNDDEPDLCLIDEVLQMRDLELVETSF